MERLYIEQEGVGRLHLQQEVPSELTRYLLEDTTAISLLGRGFKALFQAIPGNGFVVWFSRYWMNQPTVLKANGEVSTLELRISLRGSIKGSWDQIAQPELQAFYYQFNFVPHVLTRAVFEGKTDYETFDIHFDLSFLEELGLDYGRFKEFMELVANEEASELTPAPRRCTPLMNEAVQAVLHNNYSAQGRSRLLQSSVENILLAALEDVDGTVKMLAELSESQVDALHVVKALIEENMPAYLGNTRLCKKATLNLFTLNFGFKRLFGMNPYKYYQTLRMDRAKILLQQNAAVSSIAYELNYETPRAFGKAFKEWFGMTPREWRKGM
jgi:AraC-like DNA-binding protein